MTAAPAVFLDRDGTLIEESGYVSRLERVQVFPWSIDAVRLLNRADFMVIVVTNQAGIARGLVDEAFVVETHRLVGERFAACGARIDGFYYCPHHPDGTVGQYRGDCDCRKPKPGLLQRAARDLGLALDRSFVVGDRWRDIGTARAVGARGVLVATGYGAAELAQPPDGLRAAHVAENLMDAAAWILREQRRCA